MSYKLIVTIMIKFIIIIATRKATAIDCRCVASQYNNYTVKPALVATCTTSIQRPLGHVPIVVLPCIFLETASIYSKTTFFFGPKHGCLNTGRK